MRSREELENFGKRILQESRTELFLSMRFLGRALDKLSYVMDLNTRTLGTEGERIHFNPTFVFHLFLESPQKLDRLYLHVLLHCLFGHIFSGDDKEPELWGIACDIQVESVLDSMEYPLIRRPPGSYREEVYERLKSIVKVMTAERLYEYFHKNPPDIYEMEELRNEFLKDDHIFWQRYNDNSKDADSDPLSPPDSSSTSSGAGKENPSKEDPNKEDSKKDSGTSPDDKIRQGRAIPDPESELKKNWEDSARKLKAELENQGQESSDESGSLRWFLRFQYKKKADFRDFLRKISIEREEVIIDPDAFDYGYYNYGFSIYGNLPLIEENEFRVSRRVYSLVIALDTSASCKEGLVQRFLNETAGLLCDAHGFFRRFRVCIIECDNRVQKVLWFSNSREMKSYAEGFELKGGYGTDFRPVFSHVEELSRAGLLPGLKGLMYFTDGYGKYPEKARKYLSAFVFPGDEECNDEYAPDWTLRLYI